MKTLLTPKRRRLTKAARKRVDEMVAAWRDRTGAWSSNEMMGLGIRAAVLRRYLIAYAEAHDAIATGVHHIPNDSEFGIGPLRIDLDGPDGLPKGGWFEGWAKINDDLVARYRAARKARAADY